MNFGEHIENTIDKIDDMIKRNHEWNEESKALGLISDEEKLRMLKRELYCEATKTHVPDRTRQQRLTEAIQIFEEIKDAEEKRELEQRKLNLTLPAQLNQSVNAFLIFLLLAVLGAYAVKPVCGANPSQFCTYARTTVYSINSFFKN